MPFILEYTQSIWYTIVCWSKEQSDVVMCNTLIQTIYKTVVIEMLSDAVHWLRLIDNEVLQYGS